MDSFTAYAGNGEQAFRLYRPAEGVDLRSDYEARRPLRGAQKRSTPIHMGLSMWLTEDAARAKNDAFDGKLGDRMLRLELDGGLGIWWAQTFSPDHMTVWGRPDELESCIRDDYPV